LSGVKLGLTTEKHSRISSIVIEFPCATIVQEESVILKIFRQLARQPVGEANLQRLGADRLVNEMMSREVAMMVRQGEQQVRSDRLHDQVERLEVEVSWALPNAEHRRLLGQMEARVEIQLSSAASPARCVAKWSRAVTFDGQRFGWTASIGAAGSLFREGSGNYVVSVLLGDQSIASRWIQVMPLEVYRQTARDALRDGATLKGVRLIAIDHKGKTVPLETVAEDFRKIEVSLSLEMPRADPLIDHHDLSLTIEVRHSQSGLSVGSHSRKILARGGGKLVEEASLAVSPELFRSGQGRYEICVLLEDRVVVQELFAHKTRLQIKEEQAQAIFDSLVASDAQLYVMRDGGRETVDGVIFETDTLLVTTLSVRGNGFNDDIPSLKWRMSMVLVIEETGERLEKQVFLRAEDGRNAYTVEIPLKDTPVRAGNCRLRLEKRTKCLAEFTFRVLAQSEIVPYTQQVVLENLQVQVQGMFICCGNDEYQSEFVPDTSDAIVPKFTLSTFGFNRFLPEFTVHLNVCLSGTTHQRKSIGEVPVTLSRKPLILRNLLLSVRGTTLASQPGQHELIICIGGRDVVAFPFNLVTRDDLLSRLNVTSIGVNAETKTGRKVKKPATITLTEHRTIAPSLELEIGILAPNVVFATSVLLMEGEDVLMQTDFDLQLDEAKKRFKCGRIQLAMLQPRGQTPERQLRVIAVIGDQRKGQHQFTVICTHAIANFEGQLTVDPDQLEVDNAEYEEILQRL